MFVSEAARLREIVLAAGENPIDTGYRLAPEELAALLGKSSLVLAKEVDGPTYRERMRQRGDAAGEAVRTVLWTLTAPLRPKSG